MTFERQLVEDWFDLHRTKKPMNPRDPNDIQPGWIYAIYSHWKQSKSCLSEWDQFRGKLPKESGETVTYERTLADAQTTLSMEADKVKDFMMRQTSKNRFYGTDGEQSVELTIVPVHDNDAELMWEFIS